MPLPMPVRTQPHLLLLITLKWRASTSVWGGRSLFMVGCSAGSTGSLCFQSMQSTSQCTRSCQAISKDSQDFACPYHFVCPWHLLSLCLLHSLLHLLSYLCPLQYLYYFLCPSLCLWKTQHLLSSFCSTPITDLLDLPHPPQSTCLLFLSPFS